MKIFITGATGFIGTHLVNKLVFEGHKVTVNLNNQTHLNFSPKVRSYKLKKVSIQEDIDFLRNESFDGVIHLASLYLASHSPEEASELVDSNIGFATYILECTAQAAIPWFINTGTYWQHCNNKHFSPANLYAATKQAFLDIAKFYVEANAVKFCTIELFDTFGPNDTRSKILSLWNKIAKSGEEMDMSPGDQLLDISYVDDVVDAFSLLANHLTANTDSIINGQVYSVMAVKRYSLKELANIFETVTKSKLKINWGAKQYRKNEIMKPWSGGEMVPGFSSKISIEEGIEKLYR